MKVDYTISWRTCQVTRNVRLGLGWGLCFEIDSAARLCDPRSSHPIQSTVQLAEDGDLGGMGDVCSVRQGGTERSRVNGNFGASYVRTTVLEYPTRSTLGFFHRWLCGWLPARVYSQRPLIAAPRRLICRGNKRKAQRDAAIPPFVRAWATQLASRWR